MREIPSPITLLCIIAFCAGNPSTLTASILFEEETVRVSSIGEVESVGDFQRRFIALDDMELSAEPVDLDDPQSNVTFFTPNICDIDASVCRKVMLEKREVLPTPTVWELLKPPQI